MQREPAQTDSTGIDILQRGWGETAWEVNLSVQFQVQSQVRSHRTRLWMGRDDVVFLSKTILRLLAPQRE